MGCSGYTQLIKGVPIRGFSSATFNSGGSSVLANSRGGFISFTFFGCNLASQGNNPILLRQGVNSTQS